MRFIINDIIFQVIIGINVCHTSLVYFLVIVNVVGILRQVNSRFHAQYSELAPELWEYKEFRRIIECFLIIIALKMCRRLGPQDPLLINSFSKIFAPIICETCGVVVIYWCCKVTP